MFKIWRAIYRRGVNLASRNISISWFFKSRPIISLHTLQKLPLTNAFSVLFPLWLIVYGTIGGWVVLKRSKWLYFCTLFNIVPVRIVVLNSDASYFHTKIFVWIVVFLWKFYWSLTVKVVWVHMTSSMSTTFKLFLKTYSSRSLVFLVLHQRDHS